MVSLCCEDNERGGKCPEKTEYQLFLDVCIDEAEREKVHAHGPRG